MNEESRKALDHNMPTQELRLHMGELKANEVLVARAAIQWANSVSEARMQEKVKELVKISNQVASYLENISRENPWAGVVADDLNRILATFNQSGSEG